MSGGSFGYLYCGDNALSLLERYHYLRKMGKELRRLNPESLACKETEKVIQKIKNLKRAIAEIDHGFDYDLAMVWKAVEWWQSLDRSKEQAEHEIKIYESKK